ncbi:unnamed protein product [Moneuplotes crassus]|uniref:RRM domain-containing protein n=1 Tax=Euplotes crassus TaxID=5936 RepID=A0AAD1X8S5_EUPCR|nr:unnamed protein product [Moneuplotes crassus]
MGREEKLRKKKAKNRFMKNKYMKEGKKQKTVEEEVEDVSDQEQEKEVVQVKQVKKEKKQHKEEKKEKSEKKQKSAKKEKKAKAEKAKSEKKDEIKDEAKDEAKEETKVEQEEVDKEDEKEQNEINQTKESLDKLPGNQELTAFQLAERKTRTVFVGNIPVGMAPKKVWKVFKGCGKIEKIWFRSIAPSTMVTDRRNIVKGGMIGTQKNNKNAYILFAEGSSVAEAIKLNGYVVHNSDFTEQFHLRVDSEEKKDDFSSTIFVGNLPFIINEEDLRRHFERLGTIVNIRVVRDNRTCVGTGVAFIQFSTKEEVAQAVEKCKNEKRFGKFKGRELRVKRAVSTKKREKKIEKKLEKKRDTKNRRKSHGPTGQTREFQSKFVKSFDRREQAGGPKVYNDIRMKKHRRNKMMNEMIENQGESKIRERSRKFVTKKVDFRGKRKQRREDRKEMNTRNMKKTVKRSEM